ncbi:UNVERIFIED_CONTAM: hypothetical protein PYX00_001435 [Menopon gallinae]|uniref:Uncharacterized protein n=1 Tax=Menopon gallinae TaxID=328185 RepID=A0AAW2ID79_9NEOP
MDNKASHAAFGTSGLFPETEGFACAIMVQAIATKNYLKFIVKDGTSEQDPPTSAGLTNKTIPCNRPDITLMDKVANSTLPNIQNFQQALQEKLSKYETEVA